MIQISLRARYCAAHHRFQIQLHAGGLYAENMSVEQFLKMSAERDQPLQVAGMTLKFDGDDNGVVECSVRNYLEEVAESYRQHKIRCN
jgi:hypothetical protein